MIKLYVDEAGHEVVRELEGVAVSALARVELPAAFWRKQRAGEIAAEDAATVTAAFRTDIRGEGDDATRFATVGLVDELLEEAATICAHQGLRTLDGLQLASAIAARQADSDCSTFACFDRRLRDAAATSGFDLLPASV